MNSEQRQLFYLSILPGLFEFSTSGSYDTLAPNSKRTANIIIKDNRTFSFKNAIESTFFSYCSFELKIEHRKRFFKGLRWCILWLSCQNEKWVPGGRNWLGCWRWRCWCRATNLSVWFMQEKIGFWFSHHVSFKFWICWLIIDYGLEEIESCFRAGLIT